MNHYPHHIGDFDKATRHLTRLERSVYRDMIDMYMDTEGPLPLDQRMICHKIIARSTDEVTAVEQVLNEFFTKTERGWQQTRCEEVLSAYRIKNGQQSAAGKASAAKKATKRAQNANAGAALAATTLSTIVSTSVEHPYNGRVTNQEPITNNQEPEENHMSEPAGSDALPGPENAGMESKENPPPVTAGAAGQLQGGPDDDPLLAVPPVLTPEDDAPKLRKHHGSEKDYELATWMFDQVLIVNATAKQPPWDLWANDIRLMREIDVRTHQEIAGLFRWAQHDAFWCKNILSPGKLREKFDQLTVARKTAPTTKGAQSIYEKGMDNAAKAKALLFGASEEVGAEHA